MSKEPSWSQLLAGDGREAESREAELRKPGETDLPEAGEPASDEVGMREAGNPSIWDDENPTRRKPGKPVSGEVVKRRSRQPDKPVIREAGKRRSAKAGTTASSKAVKGKTGKPGKAASLEAGKRRTGKAGKRIAVKQKIGRRETIQWLGGGAQITVGTKAPEDVASYWASQAKLKRLSMSFVINMAMIEAYGLPDGAVLEEAD